MTLASDAHDQVAALGYVMRPAYLYRGTGPTVRARSGLGSNRWRSTASRRFYSNGRRRSRLRIDQAAALICYLFNFMLLGPLLHGEEMRRSRLGSRKRFADALATLAYRYLTCGEHTAGTRAGGDS